MCTGTPPREKTMWRDRLIFSRRLWTVVMQESSFLDQTLPLRSPIRHIVSSGLPVVVLGTNLGIASSEKLSYVLNDEATGGQMAARRVGKILNGKGSIAILGINSQLTG